jgi:hypothetical protein
MSGVAFTVTFETAKPEEIQPAELVPLTEYDVVTVGLTIGPPPIKV